VKRGEYRKLTETWEGVSSHGNKFDVEQELVQIPVTAISVARGPAKFDGTELHATAPWEGLRIACIAYPFDAVAIMRKGAQRILESYGFERLVEAYEMAQKKIEENGKTSHGKAKKSIRGKNNVKKVLKSSKKKVKRRADEDDLDDDDDEEDVEMDDIDLDFDDYDDYGFGSGQGGSESAFCY